MTSVTVNGNTYSDDGTSARDMRDGGHRQWFFELLEDLLTVIAGQGLAVSGNSTTSLTVGTGSKSLTIETGKAFVAGMPVRIGESGTNANVNYMDGTVTSYNTSTGALVVNVTATGGSGTIASWSVRILTEMASQAQAEAGTNNTALMTPLRVAQAIAALVALPRSYLAGLTLSNNVSDAANDIDVAVGACRSDDNAGNIILAGALTKRLDATWSAGTGNGMLDTGTIADTTYHLFAIRNPTTWAVDVLASTSVSSPTMPSGFTQKRRVGSIIRSAGAILAFTQRGDHFTLTTPVRDVSATSSGTSAVSRTLTVPSGIRVLARIRGRFQAGGGVGSAVFSSLEETDAAASTSQGNVSLVNASAGTDAAGHFDVMTNTSSQIRSRQSAGGAGDTLTIQTYGWVDFRDQTA